MISLEIYCNCKSMYSKIGISPDPKIIGVNNGIYQVELKDKKSFIDSEERKYYNNYFNGEVDDFIIGKFKNVDDKALSLLTYFPLKKAKRTDLVGFSPYEIGLNFVISEKCFDIINSFFQSEYIKIKSQIENWEGVFYTVGFPMIPIDKINIRKSLFIDIKTGNTVVYSSVNKFLEEKRNGVALKTKLIVLDDFPQWDIVNIQGIGVHFSESLINTLESNNITGLYLYDSLLNNKG